MLGVLGTYIKLAVDVEREILAGGGEYHADCEEILFAEGNLPLAPGLAYRSCPLDPGATGASHVSSNA